MASSTTWYTFKNDVWEPEELRVVDFVGKEEISRLYQFDIQLASPITDIMFENIVNKPATLEFLRGDEPQPVSGLVIKFEQGARAGEEGWVTYRATLVPRVWILTLTHQSRIFQEKTVEEIIKEVFNEAGLSNEFRFELSGSYPTREYCVQYNESDFNFICRLMEHEGIFFFFEQTPDGEVMVIADDQGSFIDIPGKKESDYYPREDSSDYDRVSDFIYREQLVTGKVVLKDYNYRTPDTLLESEKQINSEMPGMHYEYGDHFKDTGEGDQLVLRRNEAIECQRKVMNGRGDNMRFRAGHMFTLAAHYREDLNIDYLITKIEYFGSQQSRFTGAFDAQFECVFTVIDAQIPYRPQRLTPVPKIPGIMTARVETAGGDYAYIDDEGRYHVKMHFDRSDAGDGNASRPIRMNQPYSGPDYGIHFPNHANTEAVWACVDGDPDRPIIVGTVPNPTQNSPSINENKQQNVIRTWGQHELTFDDTKGSENIYLHSTKDWTIDITNDKNQTVGNNETLSVGSNREKSVGKNQSESIGENKSINVGKNHTEAIGENADVSIGSSESRSVGASQTISVGGSQSLSIGETQSETVGKDASKTVADNWSLVAGKDGEITIGKKTQIQSGDDLTITGGKKAVITIKDQLTLKCGKAEIIMKKNGDIQIKGAKINVKGSGDVKIKGSKIAQN